MKECDRIYFPKTTFIVSNRSWKNSIFPSLCFRATAQPMDRDVPDYDGIFSVNVYKEKATHLDNMFLRYSEVSVTYRNYLLKLDLKHKKELKFIILSNVAS